METTKENAATTAQSMNSLQDGQVQENEGATTMVAGENNINTNSKNSEIMEKNMKTVKEVLTVAEVQKQLVRERKKLEKLKKDEQSSQIVISRQEGIVKGLEEFIVQLSETPVEKAKLTQPTKDILPLQLAGSGEMVHRKLARVKHNRPIDQKDVDDFITIIANGEYEDAYPVITAEASKLIAAGYEVVDYGGRMITAEEAAGYLVVLDGQHRCKAFAQLNATGAEYTIPNVHIKEVENVAKYLIDINKAGSHWDKRDKFVIARLTAGEEPFTSIADRIAEGFNPSTPMLIYTGKRISDSVLNKVLKGEPYKLNSKAVVDIARGDRFITLCKAAGMPVSLITKRFFIEGFNHFALSTSDENAFKALANLPKLADRDNRLKEVKEGNHFITLLKEASVQ